MAKLTEIVENDVTRLSIVLLPAPVGGLQATRTRTVYTITHGATAVTTGTTRSSITVVATTTKLYRGSLLRFPSNLTLIVAADTAVGATVIPIMPRDFALTAAAVASTWAEAEIFGADNAGISTSTGEVDVSTFGDGVDSEMFTVSNTREITLSGIFARSGVMYEIVRPLGMNSAFAKREVYFILYTGDGSSYEGAARLTNYSEAIAFRDVLKFTSTLKIQGSLITNAPPVPA